MAQSRNGNGKQCLVDHDEERESLREAINENPLLQGYDDPALEFIRESFPAYTITRCIGRGGQGAVYEAWKDGESGTVAIKVMNDGIIATRRQRRRFQREIKLLSRLNHPGIVAIHDSGTIQGHSPYFMMPYILGCPIDVHALAEGMDIRQRIELFLDVCSAVAAAHAKGIVHRDLKPANIMVDGKDDRVRLLDFGLAKDLTVNPGDFTPSSELSLSGQRVGTARYSSPEQIKGEAVGVQSDLYSLGVVLFELLSEELPYLDSDKIPGDAQLVLSGERIGLRDAIKKSPLEFRGIEPKHVRRDLETILDTAMAVEPDLRYATVDEFAQDLRRYIDRRPVKAQIGVGQRIRSRMRAYRRNLAAAAVIALMVGAVAIGMGISARKTREVARVARVGLMMGNFVRLAQSTDHEHVNQAIDMLKTAVGLGEDIPLDDPLIRRQIYAAHQELAALYFDSSRPDEAAKHCDAAMELSETFQLAEPDDLEWLRLGGFSQKLIGKAAYENGDWGRALKHFEKALAIRKELAGVEPQNTTLKVEVSNAYVSVGKAACKLERQEDAAKLFMAAHTIDMRLAKSNPGIFKHIVRLSRSEANLGSVYMSMNDTEAAMTWFKQARCRLQEIKESENLQGCGRKITTLLGAIEANMEILFES